MDASIADLVQEVTTTSGTTQTISLVSVTGYGRFADAFVTDETCYYVIRDGSNVELGIGAVKAGNTLERAATPLVTVVAGVYDNTSPVRITLSGSEAIVACAASAAALLDAANGAYQAPINTQTGTAYTMVLGDAGNMVTMDNAAANTLTVPANASVAYPIGTQVLLAQLGAGQTTIVEDTGVTVNTSGVLTLRAQYSQASLIKIAVNSWLLSGDLG